MKTQVLVIEDNPADFRLLREALLDVNAGDVKLAHVPTLGEAMTRLSSSRFDVVLLDLSLPDTDGLDGLDKLQEAAPELPVLVLTGRNDAELAVRAVREGAQDYLIKGNVDGHLLVRAMRYAQERKRVLRQLERSEERFRSLLENALDIITVLSPEGIIKYASPSTERVLGYRPEELIDKPVRPMVHPADARMARESLWQAKSGGGSNVVECRIRRSDGEWRVLEAFGRSLIDEPGIEGIVINARDITERKAAEARLVEVNARLQAVIETCPLSIYVLDLEGRVQGWNRASQVMFGWTEAEVLNRVLPAAADPVERARLFERLAQARSEQSPIPVEAKYRRKDGATLDVNIWNSPLRDGRGRITGMVAILADVTERRRLEEQVRQGQKMEAIGRLAGGVAHDFNNLLTVITGYSQLAQNRQPPDSLSAMDLREVLQAADRAASLTKQLLALSRRQVVEPALLDVNAVVEEMQRMLHRIIGEDIELRTSLWPAVPAVRADRGQLELVLLNLAVNARDAMPGGGTLTIQTAEVNLDDVDDPARKVSGMSGPAVMLAVGDTGCGMDESVRGHLFEPFFTTKEAGKGTGLGLSTSYGIVRQHGGDIWVDSEPGAGSTFKVYLPVASADTPAAGIEPPKDAPCRGTETILLVEDDSSVANVMRQALEIQGYRVLVTNGPESALSIARHVEEPIHLLVSDLVLQSVHGVDLSRQIRALRPNLPVLFVSGYAGAAVAGRSFLEPGMRFLQKPFAPEALAAKVREVLGEGTGHGKNTARSAG